MTDKENLSLALASMHSGSWFGWKTHDDNGNKIPNSERMQYQYIKIIKDGVTMPTEAEINAKIQELKDAEQAAIDKKASGKQKLKDLGLTDDEIQALIGV